MWTTVFNTLKNFLINTINVFLAILPDCPFEKYIAATVDNETLQYVNWFIPIDDFIVIGETWLVAIGIFYLYQVVLRWLKVVGS